MYSDEPESYNFMIHLLDAMFYYENNLKQAVVRFEVDLIIRDFSYLTDFGCL